MEARRYCSLEGSHHSATQRDLLWEEALGPPGLPDVVVFDQQRPYERLLSRFEAH